MSKEREEEHLAKVLEIIQKNIDKLGDRFDRDYDKLCKDNKMHWETLSQMDSGDEAFSEANLKSQADNLNKKLLEARSLMRAKDSPYIGKIRVKFDEDDEDSYYIGHTSINDEDDIIVIDWRSAIASLFYNSPIGKTSYKAPNGTIDCELEERKQILIKNSKLLRVVDTGIHIDDDELQEILSKSSGEKMEEIVRTIQEEQYSVMTSPKDENIIIEGCAGSGKTSVALHRIAYLLFNYRETKSNNILLFTPSDVFTSYVSNVLPDLKEENTRQSTFKDFAESFLKGFRHLESYTEFVARYYNGENSEEKEKLNKFKFSPDFQKAIDEFVIRKSDTYHFKEDLVVNGCVASKDFLNNLLDSEDFKGNPLSVKIDLLSDIVFNKLPLKDNYIKDNLRNKIASDLVGSFSIRKIYNELLSSEEFRSRLPIDDKIKDKSCLEYPDIIGMLYLYFEMMGYQKNDMIHHVVIDEAQDYTPMQLKMLKKLLDGATFTLVGDSAQTINPYYKYNSLEDMKSIFSHTKYFKLDKAYRSSPEIMNYASSIIDTNINAVRGTDNIPVKVKDVSKEDLNKELVNDLLSLKENGFKRICIITKDNSEAKRIHDGLKDKIDDVTVLCDDEDSIKSKTTVSPAYMSKGLEFDAVICYNDLENEFSEDDKYLYYVGVTRAQHSLIVYNEPQKIMKKGER